MLLDVAPVCVPVGSTTTLQRSEASGRTCRRAHGLQLLPHLLIRVEELGYASVNANALAFTEFAVHVSLIDAF